METKNQKLFQIWGEYEKVFELNWQCFHQMHHVLIRIHTRVTPTSTPTESTKSFCTKVFVLKVSTKEGKTQKFIDFLRNWK
jgi:hypothetical protein